MKIRVREYRGGDVFSDLVLINYEDRFYEKYSELCNKSFYEMRVCLNRKPYNCAPKREKVLNDKDNIFLLVNEQDIIGSVSIYDNEIDDLMVNEKYKRMGYGEKLLDFGIFMLQKRKIKNIILWVAKWNQKALNLYLKEGFVIVETKVIND